jgi:hypothetical protein
MNYVQVSGEKRPRHKSAVIRTTIFDLIQELSKLTDDDNLVIAAVRDIFDSRRVSARRSLIPVRMVVTETSSRTKRDVGLERPHAAAIGATSEVLCAHRVSRRKPNNFVYRSNSRKLPCS